MDCIYNMQKDLDKIASESRWSHRLFSADASAAFHCAAVYPLTYKGRLYAGPQFSRFRRPFCPR
jgi:hypothetical protein